MIVQIYEIQTPQEAERCIELGVDHLGSVLLSQDEWIMPTVKEVISLTKATDTKNSLLPLFDDLESLYRVLDFYRPHYIHFCDSLTDVEGHEIDLDVFIETQLKLKERFPEVGVMRSIPIPAERGLSQFPSLKMARMLEPATDIFLTDTWLGREPVKGFIGITGEVSDWQVAGALVSQSGIPVILAGGLSPENVHRAALKVFPDGMDSCTRTNAVDVKGEPIRFKKDFHKVDQFVKAVRRAEREMGQRGKKIRS